MEAVDTLWWCLMCLKMPSFETQEYSGNSKDLNCPWILGSIQVFESLIEAVVTSVLVRYHRYHHFLLHKSMRQQREARRLDLQCDPLQKCPHCWGGGTGFTKIWSYTASTHPTWVHRIDASFHCTVMFPKYPKNSSNYVLSRGARPLRGAAEWKIWIHHLWPPVDSSWASYEPAWKLCEKSAFPLLRFLAGSCTRRARGWLSLLWCLPYWCKSYCCTLLVWKTTNDHVYTCLYGWYCSLYKPLQVFLALPRNYVSWNMWS